MASKTSGLQGQYAGFVSRAIGFVLDQLIIVAVIAVLNGIIALSLNLFLGVDVSNCPALESGTPLSGALVCQLANWLRIFLTIAVTPVYFALFWTLGGQSLGQYAMGLRVVRLNGKRMTLWSSLVRWVGYMVSFLALGIGFLWVLWDDRRQGFPDKFAKTVVVYSWEARQNEFLLDRIWKQLRRRRRQALPATAVPVLDKSVRLELVQVVQSTESAVRNAIRVLQGAVREGLVTIVTSTLMVKDETGALGFVGASDLAAGDESAMSEAILASDPRLRNIDAEQLTADVPNGSFIWSIIVEDKYLTAVLTTLSAAKVAAKVFDLDFPAHEPISVAPSIEASEPGRPVPV